LVFIIKFLVKMKSYTRTKVAVSHHLMGVGRTNLFRSGLKLRLGLILLMSAGLFVACSGGDDPVEPGGGGSGGGEKPPVPQDVQVRFSSALSEWTSRAANGSWEANDQVGVYMIPPMASASAANLSSAYAGAANVPYVISGSGASVSLAVASGQKAIVYPADGSQVNFVAYYPYRSANTNTYNVDVSNQSSAKAIDLLYHNGAGTAYNKNNKDVALAFTHQLSKIKISLVPASGVEADLSGATLTLTGFPATADFNLSTGALSNLGGTDKSLTPVKDPSASSAGRAVFEAIVVPHSGTSYTRNVTFTVGGKAYPYPLSESEVFEAGVARDCGFEFTGDAVVLTQNTIVDWNSGAAVGGDYLLRADKIAFDLPANQTSGNTVTLLTDAPSAPTYTLSNAANSNTAGVPEWITGVSLSNPTDNNGLTRYILTFGTSDNAGMVSRTGYIRLKIDGLTLAIRVTQGVLTNCYMVAPGGTVTIPITRAVTLGGMDASATVTPAILWDDNSVITGNPTLSGSGDARTITIQTSSRQGNAVIALKSGSTIYWSWHIWVTGYTGSATWTNNGFTFMDRNLGATAAVNTLAGRGLFYQWGRKDPFPGGKAGMAGYAARSSFSGLGVAVYVANTSADAAGIAAGILESIRKPMTFFSRRIDTGDWLPKNENTLWNATGNTKSVYDPCPAGWRVPTSGAGSASPWYGLTGQTWTSGSDTGGADWGTNAKFPAAGYLSHNSGGFSDGGRYGRNWSASVTGVYGSYLRFGYEGNVDLSIGGDRANAFSVRCARE
jgi:hypothetical protein